MVAGEVPPELERLTYTLMQIDLVSR
jgi:hypothetical protein